MANAKKLRGCSVLLVEDQYLLADELRRALADAGAEVVGPFSDAALAVAAADQAKPNCAILDINLGEGASFVPAKALLARKVPVAFVTGYGEEAIPPEMRELPHFLKPPNIEEIIDGVMLMCGGASSCRAGTESRRSPAKR
jgi:DNA-binding NarL/FixJ family response regulator